MSVEDCSREDRLDAAHERSAAARRRLCTAASSSVACAAARRLPRVDEHLLLARVEEVVLDRQRHPDARDERRRAR